MKYYWGPGRIQDGKLEGCGRIVIYEDKILVGRMNTMDHNYLLRALAARNQLDKDKVISNAIRLYYKWSDEYDGFVVAPVRRIDEDAFEVHRKEYGNLIKSEIK